MPIQISKPNKAERLRRELYGVLFDADAGLKDAVMSFCARQTADHLTARYTLKKKKRRKR